MKRYEVLRQELESGSAFRRHRQGASHCGSRSRDLEAREEEEAGGRRTPKGQGIHAAPARLRSRERAAPGRA